jgi:uncharacterized membrane protein YgaE (UPF0421/DUF939 family)
MDNIISDNNKSSSDNVRMASSGFHIGMRTSKTALVVFLCMIIYHFAEELNYFTGFDAFIACTAAIICLQDSMVKTLKVGLYRIFGTIVGAALGMLFLYVDMFIKYDFVYLLLVPVGIVVLITICNWLKINDSIVIGCVILLVILLQQTHEAPYLNGLRRLLDTTVGIVIAIAVNQYVFNPDRRKNDD